MGNAPLRLSCHDTIENFPDTGQAGGHHQVTREHTAAWVDAGFLTQAQGLGHKRNNIGLRNCLA